MTPGSMEGLRERLLRGDALRLLFADGVGFDAWVEKYANPPRVYCEGKPWSLDELDAVVARLEEYALEDGVRLEWNGVIPTKRAKASDDLV
jgi:hypothetical protein